MLVVPERPKIADVIKELPQGAVQTWGGVELLIKGAKPIFLFVVEAEAHNPMLQFSVPKNNVKLTGEALMYFTGETIAIKKFFNRDHTPTFFIFDNYMHAYAFEQKLSTVGHTVQKQKFQ